MSSSCNPVAHNFLHEKKESGPVNEAKHYFEQKTTGARCARRHFGLFLLDSLKRRWNAKVCFDNTEEALGIVV